MRLTKAIKKEIVKAYCTEVVKHNKQEFYRLADEVKTFNQKIYKKYVEPMTKEVHKLNKFSLTALTSKSTKFRLHCESKDKDGNVTIFLFNNPNTKDMYLSERCCPVSNEEHNFLEFELPVFICANNYARSNVWLNKKPVTFTEIKEYKEKEKALTQFLKDLSDAVVDFEEALKGFNTDTQLIQVWPEMEEFIPKSPVAAGNQLVVIPSKLNKLIGK